MLEADMPHRKCKVCRCPLEFGEGREATHFVAATRSFPLDSGDVDLYCEKCYRDSFEWMKETKDGENSEVIDIVRAGVQKVQEEKEEARKRRIKWHYTYGPGANNRRK